MKILFLEEPILTVRTYKDGSFILDSNKSHGIIFEAYHSRSIMNEKLFEQNQYVLNSLKYKDIDYICIIGENYNIIDFEIYFHSGNIYYPFKWNFCYINDDEDYFAKIIIKNEVKKINLNYLNK